MRFEFIHRTPTPNEVYAVHDFRGMALIGVGNLLRMYDFGKKKLLAKCENRVGSFFYKLGEFKANTY
jgi:splicing factor 3B subunit 3